MFVSHCSLLLFTPGYLPQAYHKKGQFSLISQIISALEAYFEIKVLCVNSWLSHIKAFKILIVCSLISVPPRHSKVAMVGLVYTLSYFEI